MNKNINYNRYATEILVMTTEDFKYFHDPIYFQMHLLKTNNYLTTTVRPAA